MGWKAGEWEKWTGRAGDFPRRKCEVDDSNFADFVAGSLSDWFIDRDLK